MSKARFPAPSVDYLETYSLNCEPFANSYDGRFFYGGSTLMQRLDLLTHLAQFGEPITLVSGPAGSGKTTLLGRFVAQANRRWRLCLINAAEFDNLGRRLADTLGIGDSADEQQLLTHWASESDASQLLIIVIDDSQALPEDAIGRLCALLAPALGERVRLMLFGTPEAQQAIKKTLDTTQPPCSAQLLEIPKLSEEETAAYLLYRLAVAGYSGESPFTATEVRAICKAADGRPADINRLAHEALQEHQIRSPGKAATARTGGKKTPPVWGVASLLVLAGALYLGWQYLRTPESPQAPPTIVAHDSEQAVPLKLPPPKPLPAESPPAEPAPSDTVPEPSVDAGQAAPAAPQAPGESAAHALSQETGPPAIVREEAATNPAPEPAPVAPAAEAQPPSEPVPAVQEAAALADKARAPVTAPTPATSAAPKQAEASSQPTASHGGNKETAASGPHHEAWLLQQPGRQYSLQLLGSRSEKSVLRYIDDNKLDPQQCAYYRGSFKGAPWYVLLYGVFPNQTAALAARDRLPAHIRKDKPWPRTLASVHEAIREVQP